MAKQFVLQSQYVYGTKKYGDKKKLVRDCDVFETRGGTRIYVPVNVDKHLQRNPPEHIAMAIEQLPLEERATLKAVFLMDCANPDDVYWAISYKMKGFRSHATGGNGIVRFYNFDVEHNEVEDAVHTLRHECGHNIDKKYNQLSQKNIWAKAVKADKKQSGQTSVSWYGSKSPAEDFAESFVGYLEDRGKFFSIFPHRTKIIRSLLRE